MDINDILDKLEFGEVDSNELIDKLLFTNPEFFSILRDNFKNEAFEPMVKALFDFYKKITQKIENRGDDLSFLDDVINPIKIPDDENAGVFSEKRDGIWEQVLSYYDNYRDEVESKLDDLLDDFNIEKTPQKSPDLYGGKSSETSNDFKDQKSIFDEPTEISFSKKTEEFIIKSLKEFGGGDSETNFDELLGKINENPIEKKGFKILEFLKDLSMGLGLMLLSAGTLMMFAEPIWDNFVKPFLEKTFNLDLKTFDEMIAKFGQLWDGLSKWFTIGGLGGVGISLKIGGFIFESFTQIITKNLDSILKPLLSMGGNVASGAKLIGWLGGLPAKLFGSISKVALKSIPFIGSLFSFKFAYDDFTSGDIVGGSLNLVSGIANLFGPVGWGLSLGIDVLNAILEMKSGGVDESGNAITKGSILKDWVGKISNTIRELPIVKWFTNLSDGFFNLIYGNFSEAVENFKGVPILSPIANIIDALSKSINTVDESGNVKKFDFKKFNQTLRENVLKSIVSWIPNQFGLRKKVANFLGVSEFSGESDSSEEIGEFQPSTTPSGSYVELMKSSSDDVVEDFVQKSKDHIEKMKSKLKEYKAQGANSDLISDLEEKIERTQNNIKDVQTVKVQDASIPQSNSDKYISVGDKRIIPDDNDNILLYQGQTIEKVFNNMENILKSISNNIIMLNSRQNENENQNINVVNNNTNNTKESKPNNFGGRDAIFDARMDYWRIANVGREMI
jgi:hypothetical protein